MFSVTDDIRTWQARTWSSDFMIRTMMPDTSGHDPVPLPDGLYDQVKAIKDVATTEAISAVRVDAGGHNAIMLGRDFSIYPKLPLDLVRGEPTEVRQKLLDGEAVLGSVLAEHLGVKPGDTVHVIAGEKAHDLRVAGETNEYLIGGSIVFIDRATAEKVFDLHKIDTLLITAKPGHRDEIHELLKPITEENGILLQSYTETMRLLDSMVAGVTGGLWALLTLGLLVGALGVVNTLTMNILEQTRELGMLRAIGMEPLSGNENRAGPGDVHRAVGPDRGYRRRTAPGAVHQSMPGLAVRASCPVCDAGRVCRVAVDPGPALGAVGGAGARAAGHEDQPDQGDAAGIMAAPPRPDLSRSANFL